MEEFSEKRKSVLKVKHNNSHLDFEMDSVDYLIALFDQERSGKRIVCLLLNTGIFVSASNRHFQVYVT